MRKMLIFGLLLTLLFGCQKENDTDFKLPSYKSNALLKRKLLYTNTTSKNPISIVEVYEYDKNDRISKISSPLYENGEITGLISYDLYRYDESGKLIKIANFNANSDAPSGFINLKNYTYSYDSNGLKKKEQIDYPQINSFEYSIYEYEDKKLIKTKKYNGNKELERYTDYKYESENLSTETSYTPNGDVTSFTKHTFTNGLNTKTEIYRGSEIEKIREIKKTYDVNRNLIMVESNELSGLSSTMSYVMRYEYY